MTKLWYKGVRFLNDKAQFSKNFSSDSILFLFETFLAHFLNGPFQQNKKQLTVILKFRNERLSKHFLPNTSMLQHKYHHNCMNLIL